MSPGFSFPTRLEYVIRDRIEIILSVLWRVDQNGRKGEGGLQRTHRSGIVDDRVGLRANAGN